MARKKRITDSFSMSFLDIMSCGFGAVILFFVIIQHATVERADNMTAEISAESDRLQIEVALEELNGRVKLQNMLEEIDEEITSTDEEAGRVMQALTIEEEDLSEQQLDSAARREHLNKTDRR